MQKMLRAPMLIGTGQKQLKTTLTQDGPPTIYWAMSCAEFHWPEFHSLLTESEIFYSENRRQNIINTPHIIELFFCRTGFLKKNGSMIC